MLSKTARGVMGGEENERMGMDKVGSVVMLRKRMANRKMRLFCHIVKHSIERILIPWKGEGGRQVAKWHADQTLHRLSLYHILVFRLLI